MFNSFQPNCLYASDLHIGSSFSHYTRAWNWLLNEIKHKHFNRLVINGDFGSYQETHHPEELTGRLRAHLQEALDANPELKIYMIRGNHDMVKPFHDILLEMSHTMPRFFLSDILFMGKDVAFMHGDTKMRKYERRVFMPEDFRVSAQIEAQERSDAGKPPKPWCVPVKECRDKIAGIDGIDNMFTYYADPHFETIQKVFIGHIHPEKPMMAIPCNGRQYYVTGASLVGGECTIIGLHFEADGTSKKPEIVYSEPIQSTHTGFQR